MPVHLICQSGTRADVQAEMRRLTAHFGQVNPVPHDVDVEALRCQRIGRAGGPGVYGSEGPHPEAFGPIFDLYGWADYVLVAGHLLLYGLALYEQFRDGRGPAGGASDARARDLYDQLSLPTLPWSRNMKQGT
jgi:hypothetical protein